MRVEVHASLMDGLWYDALGLGTLAMDLGAGRGGPKTRLIMQLALNSMLVAQVKKGDRLGVIHQRRANKPKPDVFTMLPE